MKITQPHSNIISLSAIIAILFLSSCGIFNKNKGTETTRLKNETYEEFYQKFHSDMTFQVERISFTDKKIKSVPTLTGFNDEGKGKNSWTSENWINHRAKMSSVDRNLYEVDIQKGDDKVVETLTAKDKSLFFTRTFQKIKGKWHLVHSENISH